MIMLPHFICLRDATGYLNMNIHRFNHEVRLYVSQIRIGQQGITLDRLDLDSWADKHKQPKGALVAPTQRSQLWHQK